MHTLVAVGLLFHVDAFSPLQTTVGRSSLSTTTSSKTIRFATIPEQDEEQLQDDPIVAATNGALADPAAAAFNRVETSLFDGVPYEELTIGVLKEDLEGENRVSQTPDTVRNLVKAGFNVVVEKDGTYQMCGELLDSRFESCVCLFIYAAMTDMTPLSPSPLSS